jgi:indole-3-glycerol phosphate synthase
MTILDRIVADNRETLEARKGLLPLAEIGETAGKQPPARDMAAALTARKNVSLIAEVKKASPSKGVIRKDFDPAALARIYAGHGAAAISVLTESKHFQGSINYLTDIRKALGESRVPLLRKDFIHDPYQVYEARAYGADCILLIAAILPPEKLRELVALTHETGMSCLVEVHDEGELAAALDSGARIIGINNRDLNTFQVDIATTRRLRPLIPADRIVVSESGIRSRNDMLQLAKWRVDAALAGEVFMASQDIAGKMRELLLDQD